MDGQLLYGKPITTIIMTLTAALDHRSELCGAGDGAVAMNKSAFMDKK
jgi:hypothetical protein